MLEVTQFKNKVRTHGLLHTLLYTAEFMVRPLRRELWVEPFLKSYSQRYEDVLIDNLLGNKNTGTYLDIGAYDPHRLSNTKRFYDRGWRGCNIEPNPRRFHNFQKARPNDINLNVGLAGSAGKLIFFEVVPEALSTFSEHRAKQLSQMGAKIRKEVEIPVLTMKDVFGEHFKDWSIDFCTIDTEGMDLTILKGNDWSRFRPRVICVEVSLVQEHGAADQKAESVESFFSSVGYKQHCTTGEFGVPLNEIYVSET